MMFFFILLFAISVLAEKSAVLGSDIAYFGSSEKEFFNQQPARRKLDDIHGSISIDCGIPDNFCYKDNITELHYSSDSAYINTGVNKNISLNFISETLHKSLANVRSFPQGTRNCYTLSPPEGRNTVYMIRASFMYGNYDEQDRLPQFDLYVGVNTWDSVKFDNASHILIKEIMYFSLSDEVYVCLINTGFGTPFISALELRHFHDSSYRPQSGSLVLYKRLDVGSTTNHVVRFKDDIYDRMWFPYNIPRCESLNTSFTIDSLNHTKYQLPSTVMRTSVRPSNASESLDFDIDNSNPILDFYIYLHFAELEQLQENQHREFNISLNGNPLERSVVPNYLHSTTINNMQSVRGTKLSFSLQKTGNSTLPPILNALEIYVVIDALQKPTVQEDVNAIMDIKSKVVKNWQGDPCKPIQSWDGLNCSNSGYDAPRIISLNLSSTGLTGKILASLSNLKSLQYLDLSNNSLSGALPDFLSQLPQLRFLNLEGNKFSGSVPSSLMEKSNKGSLTLRVEGNPDLCVMPPCKEKEENNLVVPLVASIIPALAVLIALLSLWVYKTKKAAKPVVKSYEQGQLKSDNRQFTYSQAVSITNNFQTIIGKGGFGTVYLGYLDDGAPVAVKMLSVSAEGFKQFQTEAQLLMRVHHRNLASLVGYCNESPNIGIIYEYMANGNLQDYLSAADETKHNFSWKNRIQIAVDAAQGLEYLHHGCKPPIIHRDVKTANILLTENLRAKIADFGFSKDFPIDGESHLSTSVVGTRGYLDPEYYISNRLTEKSDVYSFGIVLLELITGQPAIMKSHLSNDNTHIVNWVAPLLARADIGSIVDPRLQRNFDTNSVWKAMETAMECLPSISIQRPSMSHVLVELKESLAIEIAREQTRGMESQRNGSSNTFEINAMDLEAKLGPQAR